MKINFLDQGDQVLEKGLFKNTCKKQACMRNLMKVDAEGVCEDHSNWKEVFIMCTY
jgi:hypothetical protein